MYLNIIIWGKGLQDLQVHINERNAGMEVILQVKLYHSIRASE